MHDAWERMVSTRKREAFWLGFWDAVERLRDGCIIAACLIYILGES